MSCFQEIVKVTKLTYFDIKNNRHSLPLRKLALNLEYNVPKVHDNPVE